MPIAAGVSSLVVNAATTSAHTTGAVTTQASGSAFLAVYSWENAATFVSLVDSKSNTYTQIGSEITFASRRARAYYCENGTGGASHTATLNISGNDSAVGFFLEITGGLTSGILDDSDARQDNASPFTTASGVDTTQADTLIVSAMFGDSGSNPATHAESGIGSSTIHQAQEDGSTSGFWTGAIASAVKSSTGNYNCSWTESGGADSAVFVFAFKAAAGGGVINNETLTDALLTSDGVSQTITRWAPPIDACLIARVTRRIAG